MRERVTFVQGPGADVDPASLQIEEAGLLGPRAESTREDRYTLSVNELPAHLAALLGGYEELHLRWASPLVYDSLDPFASRLSPGLHVSHVPAKSRLDDPVKLCSLLQAFGPLDCMDPEAFTRAVTDRNDDKGAFYFYQELENLSALIASSGERICPDGDSICRSRLRNLLAAASLDVSYDSASQSLKTATFWPLRERTIAVPASPERRTEIGIFAKNTPPNMKPYELGVAALLSVLGQQKEPSPSVFTIPSRHRLSGATFSSAFLEPTGLHPTLQLRFGSNKTPLEDAGCALHAFFTLPKTIFADRYQYEDELFLASKNLTASRYTSLPVDLEAPAYTTKTWGSSVLVELAPPSSETEQAWTAEVPLHLRYMKPSASGHVPIEIPYPAVFWACEAADEADLSTNPFDRRHLGYDGLFGPRTVFWHVSPKPDAGNRAMAPLSVPVLKEEAAAWVGPGTTAVVALGFAWVLWKLLGAYLAAGPRRSTAAGSGKRDKKDQ